MKRFILGSLICVTLPLTSLADTVATPATSPDTPQAQPTTTAPKMMDTKPASDNNSTSTTPTETSTSTTAPASNTAPATSDSVEPVNAAPAKPVVIDCHYKLGDDVSIIPEELIKKWSVKAAEQSFSFSFDKLNENMQTLEACFTKNGWKSFNTALKRSGNMETITKEKLNVSPQITGNVVINQEKDNQWKVTLPMTITYQNDKNKIAQELNVSLLIGRKKSGDLGIMQLIAAPANASGTHAPNTDAEKKDEAK